MLAAVVVLCVTACGEAVDEDEWKSDLASIDVEPDDWEAYKTVWVDEFCEASTSQLGLTTTLNGAPSEEEFEVSIRHACPDRLADVKDAFSSVDDAVSDVDEACGTPAAERTEDQAQLAEAMGC